ncbi:MAG: ABC transporter permease, partial [Bacteroidota bacterium]|nr:ABC transporter permease [Bacteroidota bacterium]
MKQKQQDGSSFFRRLFKNKGATLGLILISIALLLALFCYFLAPDSTPYANRMIPEIGSRKPGTTIQLLRVKRDRTVPEENWFSHLLNGKEDRYQYLPVTLYSLTADSIVFEKYIDEGISERKSLPLSVVGSPPVISQTYYLGTDKFGRDMLSRLLIGVRVSLSVGLIA